MFALQDEQQAKKKSHPIASWKMAWTNLVWRVPGLMHLGSIKAGAKMYYRARVRMLPSILLRLL